MFIRKNWKSLWIVKSETTVDVPEGNGCILPEHPALLSTHCVSGSPPEPDGFPEQQQQIPLLLVLPAQQCPALLCPLLFMCPSSLHLLPQQHKCFSQNLPAYPGSSWEALAIYLPLQLSQGFPFCTFPNLSSCHLHHSQWLWQSQCWALQFCLQKPSTVRGCPCPRSLCPGLQPVQTGQHTRTEEDKDCFGQ